jgi:hypothetical protein
LSALAVVVATALPAAAAPRPGYTISLPEQIELAAGQGGEVSLTIAPQAGYTISRSGPLRVSLSAQPVDAVELPRRRYQRAHAADRLAEAPRFDLAVRGVRPGRHRLAIDVLFWVCRGRTCRPIRAERAVAIEVRPAAPTRSTAARPAGRGAAAAAALPAGAAPPAP